MEIITIPASLVEPFLKAKQVVNICDASGNALGQFVPFLPTRTAEDFEELEWDDAELDRRTKSTVRYTTQEVLDYLKKLG